MREPPATPLTIYHLLHDAFGPQYWWPGDTRIEIIVGAILTQNTAWSNVERAIANLKRARLLSVKGLRAVNRGRLATLIRPSGYFNQKALKLKSFIAFLDKNYGGRLEKMQREDTALLREKLLSVHGIGPETADSILCYAFNRPVFVVDAYTRRIACRHGIVDEKVSYDELQRAFTRALPQDTRLFNEYHALMVRVGKELCGKRKPRCDVCPLWDIRSAAFGRS